MFSIDKENPTAPKLINSRPSLGTFPNAIAYSAALKTGHKSIGFTFVLEHN